MNVTTTPSAAAEDRSTELSSAFFVSKPTRQLNCYFTYCAFYCDYYSFYLTPVIMTPTKLISIRVPVDLLDFLDRLAAETKPMTRSSIIVNLLQAIHDAADRSTVWFMSTWPERNKKYYSITATFDPHANCEDALSELNLITP